MFESLLSDDRKRTNEQNSMERINVRSENGQFEQVESQGALLHVPEELGEEVESSKRTTEEGIEIIELSSGGEPIGDSDLMRESLSIDPESESASKFFTEEELSEIKSHQDRFSEEDIDSVKKVEKAIQNPDIPAENRSELWTYLCKKEEKFGMGEEEEYTSKEEAIQDQLGDRDWVSGKRGKTLNELEAGEFVELLQEAQNGNQEEELSEPEPVEFENITEEQEEEVDTVSEELSEVASTCFQNRAKKTGKQYWNDIAEDLSIDIPDTKVESIEEGRKRIVTSNQELKTELMQVHKSSEYPSTQVHKRGDGTVVAKVPEGIEV